VRRSHSRQDAACANPGPAREPGALFAPGAYLRGVLSFGYLFLTRAMLALAPSGPASLFACAHAVDKQRKVTRPAGAKRFTTAKLVKLLLLLQLQSFKASSF
jgi:hypothetical protein